MLQRYTFQKFHGDERMAVLLADVMNGANVGVIQRGRSLRFALKARQCVRIARNFRREKLERHETVQACVLGLVNHTHSATSELLQNAIMGDSLADERARSLTCTHILGWARRQVNEEGAPWPH